MVLLTSTSPRSGAAFFNIARMRLSTSLARLPSLTTASSPCLISSRSGGVTARNRLQAFPFMMIARGGLAYPPLNALVGGWKLFALSKAGNATRRCLEHAPPARLAGAERRFRAAPPQDLLLEVCGTFGDAPLKFRIGLPQPGFGTLPVIDFFAKSLVGLFKLRRARQRQRERHHFPDRDGRADREHRRHRLDAAVEPIIRKPERPDAHDMRGAAGKDEQTGEHENGGECQIGALVDKIDQGDRDRIIG